jgi:hypothetical protein
MYLWKVDSLVEDFKSGKVTQKEEFKYALLFTIARRCTNNCVTGYLNERRNHDQSQRY